jgi:GT2 family glycosyltransferase
VKFEITIVIPIHNSWEISERCIQSVINNRDQNLHQIIAVDDGSQFPVAQELLSFSNSAHNFAVVTHRLPKGFAASANAGLKLSDSEITIILNSDTEVSHGWLSKIYSTFKKSKRIGIVGPLSNAAGSQSIPRNSARTNEEISTSQTVINVIPRDLTLSEVNQVLEKHMPKHLVWAALIHGFCFAIRRETIDEVGYFDEKNFPRGYGEENDYCIRATNAGWGHVVALDTFVWHHKSASFSDEERVALKKKGMDNLIRKHGKNRISNVVDSSSKTGMLIEQLWVRCEEGVE